MGRSRRLKQNSQHHRPTPRKRWRRILLACGVLYSLVLVGCASFQRRMIYFPPVFDTTTTDRIGATEKLERWIAPSGKPIGWKRPVATQPAVGRVLILHGNAGCAVQCGRYADMIQRAAPFDVFIVEYPGYADRPGKPTEETLEQSADEALQLLAAKGPLYLVGESLGTGVAAYLAGAHPDVVSGLVLLAPYSSLTEVAQAHVRILPVGWIFCDPFPALEHLRYYHGPVVMLVGGEDKVVPAKFGRRLYEGYAGPKRLWEFPAGNHGTVMDQPPEMWKVFFDFLQTNGPSPAVSAR